MGLIVVLGWERRKMIAVIVPLIQVVVLVAAVLRHLDMIGNGNINQSLKREDTKEETEMMILLTRRVRKEGLVIQSIVVNGTKEMNTNGRRKIKDLIDIDVRGVA